MENIKPFLDDSGKIMQMPSKRAKRLEVLQYLGTKFEPGKEYREKEVNAIIDMWHTFGDYFLLRRELVDAKILNRTRDGAKYWRDPKSREEENA
jgi:hypothetical protein